MNDARPLLFDNSESPHVRHPWLADGQQEATGGTHDKNPQPKETTMKTTRRILTATIRTAGLAVAWLLQVLSNINPLLLACYILADE